MSSVVGDGRCFPPRTARGRRMRYSTAADVSAAHAETLKIAWKWLLRKHRQCVAAQENLVPGEVLRCQMATLLRQGDTVCRNLFRWMEN